MLWSRLSLTTLRSAKWTSAHFLWCILAFQKWQTKKPMSGMRTGGWIKDAFYLAWCLRLSWSYKHASVPKCEFHFSLWILFCFTFYTVTFTVLQLLPVVAAGHTGESSHAGVVVVDKANKTHQSWMSGTLGKVSETLTNSSLPDGTRGWIYPKRGE